MARRTGRRHVRIRRRTLGLGRKQSDSWTTSCPSCGWSRFRGMTGGELVGRVVSYDAGGVTLHGGGVERTALVGWGPELWAFAGAEVLRWGGKTPSGFEVADERLVAVGNRYWIVARIGPLRVREPVEVVAYPARWLHSTRHHRQSRLDWGEIVAGKRCKTARRSHSPAHLPHSPTGCPTQAPTQMTEARSKRANPLTARQRSPILRQPPRPNTSSHRSRLASGRGGQPQGGRCGR